MLGAIIATVISLFVTAQLPARTSRIYDPEVSLGKIMVAVESPRDQDMVRLERALRASGIQEVRRIL
jgi:hypothetical protein